MTLVASKGLPSSKVMRPLTLLPEEGGAAGVLQGAAGHLRQPQPRQRSQLLETFQTAEVEAVAAVPVVFLRPT